MTNGESFKAFCNGCERHCCSAPVALPEEKKRIAEATRMGFFEQRRIFKKRGEYYIIKGEVCPFLKSGSCSIEPIKPLNCRVFPLALTHLGKDAEWGLSPECPASRNVPYDFVEHAKSIGQRLLEKHREKGPLI